MEQKAKWKLVITNLETGEVEAEHETNCIIGAVVDVHIDDKTKALGMTCCDPLSIMNALDAVDTVQKTILMKNPLLALGYLAQKKEHLADGVSALRDLLETESEDIPVDPTQPKDWKEEAENFFASRFGRKS